MSDWFASVPLWLFLAQLYLIVYGILALTHLLIQYTFALLHNRRVSLDAKVTRRHRHDRSAPVPKEIAVWVPVFQEKDDWLKACLKGLLKAKKYFEGEVEGGRVTVLIRDDGSFQKLLHLYSQPQPEFGRWMRVWYWVRRKKLPNYPELLAHYQKRHRDLIDILLVYRGVFDIPQLKYGPQGWWLDASNAGKRHVQFAAWERCKEIAQRFGLVFQLYVTVDSDTVLDVDAIYRIALNFRNPRVGAATGYVDVGNWNRTWLTRLIDMRYWSAFHVERAAQSYWNCVMCCSGPLAAYRAEVADQLMEQYANQMFRKKVCTFGDDRHLTNLFLAGGWLVVMDPTAHCLTDVPEKIRQYLPQQKRWSMSFYREMLWSLDGLRMHSGYMTYDLVMQFTLPFLLMGGLGVTVVLAVVGDAWATIGLYVATIFAVGFLRSLYPFFTRKPVRGREDEFGWARRFSQLLFMGYGVVHVTLLVPLRFVALVSLWLGTTAWGTRTG